VTVAQLRRDDRLGDLVVRMLDNDGTAGILRP
jgi:hypothetical protein